MRLLILRLANLFAKPQQHIFETSASGGSVTYYPMDGSKERSHSLAFAGYELRQEGLARDTRYLVSNRPIAGAKVLNYRGTSHEGSYLEFGGRAAVGLRFCRSDFRIYFPITPLKLYIKEDHV